MKLKLITDENGKACGMILEGTKAVGFKELKESDSEEIKKLIEIMTEMIFIQKISNI